MKMIFVYGWDLFHPELVEKVEEFILTWYSSEENASYTDAVFHGVIIKGSEKFEEVDEGEVIPNLLYHVECHLVKGGKEVYTTLLRY